ncbi:hypothetical protein [Ignavibacterium album]|uniref:hypothetical protein n=1 Tax=Ignavibacterium album TaxID=591197 RepID=UPI000310A13B|nr:hypothetical protein [Ignavibacterium album]
MGKLRDVLKKVNYLKTDTWPKEHAFEKSYWEAFRSYNGAEDYPNKVFNHIKDNLPKKF